MIQSVSIVEHKTEYLRRIANKPYFEAVLGTHLRLFGQHPASGWAFYLLPGTAVLELRGGSAVVCGALPGGSAGEDACEELAGFLRFLCADRLRTEQPLALAGWQPAAPLTLWELPQGSALPLPPAYPAELVRDTAPSMLPVSRLVFAENDAEADEFYSTACTALAHGVGVCCQFCYWYIPLHGRNPAWRGRGLARRLIVEMANTLAAERTVRFACEQTLCGFYEQLGFVQNGKINYYTTDWNMQ